MGLRTLTGTSGHEGTEMSENYVQVSAWHGVNVVDVGDGNLTVYLIPAAPPLSGTNTLATAALLAEYVGVLETRLAEVTGERDAALDSAEAAEQPNARLRAALGTIADEVYMGYSRKGRTSRIGNLAVNVLPPAVKETHP